MEIFQWSKKLCPKLLILLCLDIFFIKHNFLFRYIAAKFYILIMGSFLQFLHIEQVLLTNGHQFSQLFYQFIGRARSQVKIDFILKKHTKMIVVIKLKRHMAGTYILSIVIPKFRYRQVLYLIIVL